MKSMLAFSGEAVGSHTTQFEKPLWLSASFDGLDEGGTEHRNPTKVYIMIVPLLHISVSMNK